MAFIIKTDGSRTEVELPTDEDARLAALQEAVGGYIEIVTEDIHGGVVYANEEGLLQGLPVNIIVTTLVGRPIVGDCIVLSPEEAAIDRPDD